ncbi:MAG: signal recognition particle-docking protein FtsY [Clostridia bacterium]|jgi:fused signal recognition particle receptor|nr:signal recognition particle-docking protein FtsY [Clostridia bacterium]
MSIFREKKGFFGSLGEKISNTLFAKMEVDEEVIDNLEELLVSSDIGMETTMTIMDEIREKISEDYLTLPKNVKKALMDILIRHVDKGDRQKLSDKSPLLILMIGINGGGKTTTIGKLAYRLKKQGKSVVLAAADTFRAAASEQLSIWGERNDIPVIKQGEGADPSAVIFDAIQSAKARHADVLICDTAGRLQTKKNLMNELAKMDRVISREWPEADRETLLILDATTGKNAISQAEEFGNTAEITGVVLTKLDGTAKGGIAITIADEFDIPIKFIGTGEGIEDLEPFDAAEFIGGLFDE